jgi:hypothetical protein
MDPTEWIRVADLWFRRQGPNPLSPLFPYISGKSGVSKFAAFVRPPSESLPRPRPRRQASIYNAAGTLVPPSRSIRARNAAASAGVNP